MILMSNDASSIDISLTPEFKRNLKKLAKRYRNIRLDIQSIIEELQKGNFLGDRLSGYSDQFIYKVRVKNTNIKKGKSAGYRLIYLLESETTILLLTIYSKSDQEDITVNEVQAIVDEFYD